MIIHLSKGYSTIVDNEDYEFYSKFKWYSHLSDGKIYAVRRVRVGARKLNKKKTIRLHREIMAAKDGELVDHINGNSLDNRKINLRLANNQQNSSNRKHSKNRPNKGVRKNRQCSTWSARITVNRKELYLGCYKTEVDAALAYNEAAIKYFGEFANLNKDLK